MQSASTIILLLNSCGESIDSFTPEHQAGGDEEESHVSEQIETAQQDKNPINGRPVMDNQVPHVEGNFQVRNRKVNPVNNGATRLMKIKGKQAQVSSQAH